MIRRRGAGALGALVLALALLVSGASDAAVTVLGSTFAPTASGSCGSAPDWEIFQVSAATVPSAQATSPGVITSWSFLPGAQTTTLAMRVFRATATAGAYTVVADSGPKQTFAAGSGLHTVPTRVPVQAGDFVGVDATGGTCASISPNGGDAVRDRVGAPTAVGATGVYSLVSTPVIVDLSATFEPDADGDGYGDETQDACPGLASTQAPCPTPDTTITEKPKNPHAKVSKLKFTSTVSGSTFRCTLDKKKAHPCLSPAKFVCLKPGKHVFSVFATSPLTLADPTPATVKFKVKAPVRGC